MLRIDQLVSSAPPSSIDEFTPPVVPPALPHGESVVAMAQSELLSFQNDAMMETQEDLSFALGGKLLDTRRNAGSTEGARGRVMAEKLIAELAEVGPIALDDVFDGKNEWTNQSNPLLALQQRFPDPGQLALQLASALAYGRPSARLRQRLNIALAELISDDTIALSLFGALEFGATTPALRQDLQRLYHRASATYKKLSQWLALLGDRENRGGKLRTMIRILAFDLSISGQPIVGSHLAAVIADLHQLLRIIGLEAHCDQSAQLLAQPQLDGDGFLAIVVDLVEQTWVSADNVAEVASVLDKAQHYRFAHTLSRLIQLLPDDCFADNEHRLQLETAIASFRDSVAE
ncbi:TyeA family type III secretion system gatekeeper subunit [Chitinimonas sp. BJB300]|uniref:TyeA family type III secretion system gatekeeper subunit n=1 Tax=Chitinimonas sp. BJB300 TaxID=1559339 RepID=UPI000C0F6AA9|nr:TyeA family type III secretion system gatekeeper subunit [Chitinimonas sp. BJB300]PHV11501.1 TyeA family type III secretion system gatekeeper subunit [Chitinimonas sp. BJB300]TSJ88504.1 TyeA family type III secretion system gatekeeper subunit [Chitinimonas sp. BJB300]